MGSRLKTMDDDMNSLSQRVARLEAERDIAALLARCAHCIDYGHGIGWVECFTPDGRFEVYRPAGDVTVAVGTEELTAFATGRKPSASPSKHFTSQLMIEVDGDTATARSYFALLKDVESEPSLDFYGRYLDDLVRGPDNLWRIASRVTEGESRR